MIEVVGHANVFDYIEYVAEYSPFSLELMDNLGRALDLFPNMSSMIKVEEQTRGFIAQHAIDSGIQNVLFTDIRTVEDARECVRLVRSEHPAAGGVHGACMRRAVGYVLEGGRQSWVDAMNDVVIALMIEKRPAMENLEGILAVEGIDMVQFGPTDYSVSVGKPGGGRDPEVQDAQKRMVEMALERGVQPRIELGSLEQAGPWRELGVTHFCVGWDIATVFGYCKRQGALMEEMGLKAAEDSGEIGYAAARQ
jgi:4-hydroxy-2-oxoheptanedioate aldolase